MLKEDKTEKRKKRHAITQEDFTPNNIVLDMLNTFSEESFATLNESFIDPSCGNGNFLVAILQRKLNYCTNIEDICIVLKSIYGIDLMADNIEECRERLYQETIKKFPDITKNSKANFQIRSIIRNRIQWCDSLNFDYNHWPKLNGNLRNKHKNVSFKVTRTSEDTKYPMWYKEKIKIKELLLFSDKDFL